MKCSFGWIPDRMHHLGDYGLPRLGHRFALQSIVDVTDFRPYRRTALGVDALDQSTTNVCVAHGIVEATCIRAAIVENPIPLLSRRAVYANGQTWPYVDEGLIPRNAILGCVRDGFVAETKWPWDPSRVTEPVPWDVYRDGADARLERYERIDTQGQARLDDIRRALSAGFPITYGQTVDAAFMDYQGGVLGAWKGPPEGGHMTCIIGHNLAERWFLVLNSWGPDWGENGCIRIDESRLADPEVSDDFYVLEGAPAVST